MSEDVLERRYRRLLALYSRPFRREHEVEMLAVLLAGGAGRRYPGAAEAADLLRSAAWARVRPGARRSEGTVFAAVRLRDPAFTAAQWHAVVSAHIVPDTIGEPIAAVVWIWLAGANGRGRRWAPAVFAPAATGVAGVLWLLGGATLGLLFHRRPGSYFGRTPARGPGSPWRDTLA